MTQTGEKARKGILDYRMIWRWHFYAGLFCVPFIILLTLTGIDYNAKKQCNTQQRPHLTHYHHSLF